MVVVEHGLAADEGSFCGRSIAASPLIISDPGEIYEESVLGLLSPAQIYTLVNVAPKSLSHFVPEEDGC